MTRSATPSSEALNAASRYHQGAEHVHTGGQAEVFRFVERLSGSDGLLCLGPSAVAGGVRHIARGNPCLRWSLPTQIGVE